LTCLEPGEMATVVTLAELVKQLGKNVASFCPNGYTNDDDNHCAHFVSHTLDFSFGYTCSKQAGGQGVGANVRVHELFSQCPEVGKWADRSAATPCLAFVTAAGNVKLKTKIMANVGKKHVGIFCDGSVFHYSNTKDQVVKVSPEEFAKHYAGSEIAVFYGTFPG
jgi:hypothetical protein